IDRGIEAIHEEFFGLRRWSAKTQRPQRPNFRNDPNHECEQPRTDSRPTVFNAPRFFVICTRYIVEKLLASDSGLALGDLVFLHDPGDLGHFRNEPAYRLSVRTNCEVERSGHVFDLEPVRLPERALDERLCNFETDEIMVCIGNVTAFSD